MQINAVRNISFSRAKNPKDVDKNAGNVSNVKKNFTSLTARYSEISLNNEHKLSDGREAKNGAYKLGATAAEGGALLAGIWAFGKSVKSLKLNKELQKAVKNSASKERIEELKTGAIKKQKASIGGLFVSLALTAAAIGVTILNRVDADKTSQKDTPDSDEALKQDDASDKTVDAETVSSETTEKQDVAVDKADAQNVSSDDTAKQDAVTGEAQKAE